MQSIFPFLFLTILGRVHVLKLSGFPLSWISICSSRNGLYGLKTFMLCKNTPHKLCGAMVQWTYSSISSIRYQGTRVLNPTEALFLFLCSTLTWDGRMEYIGIKKWSLSLIGLHVISTSRCFDGINHVILNVCKNYKHSAIFAPNCTHKTFSS